MDRRNFLTYGVTGGLGGMFLPFSKLFFTPHKNKKRVKKTNHAYY